VAKSPEARCTLDEITEHQSRLPLQQDAAEVRREMEVIDIAQPDLKPHPVQPTSVE